MEWGAMSQTNLTKWIEQAEERAVCELAKAEPGLVKLWLNPTAAHRSAARLHVSQFMSRFTHRFGAVERIRGAA